MMPIALRLVLPEESWPTGEMFGGEILFNIRGPDAGNPNA